MSHPSRRGSAAAALIVLLLGLGLPAAVAADAELDTVSPADGVTITVAPTEIVMVFTQALDPAKSSIVLAEVGGAQVLSGGVVDSADATRMTLAIPELSGGTYEVRWTSASAEDPHIKRGTTTFTYAPPPPSPTDAASPSPSPSPSASTAPTVPSAAPSPSPSADGTPAASSTDVLLPILAAIAVVVLLGAWLLRNRSRGARP